MDLQKTPSRRLVWDACLNTRDLGGLPTTDGSTTRWRVLVRSDNLCRLSEVGRAAIGDYGVRTIVDLRLPFEHTIDPNPFIQQMGAPGTPICLPLSLIEPSDEAGLAAMDEMESVAEMYRFMLDRYQTNIAAIMRAVAGADDGALLFYCHAGKDRTGLIAALCLALVGVPDELIAADYAESDQNLQPLYEQMLARAADDPKRLNRLQKTLYSRAETMLAVLDYLREQYGGVETYLLASGVSKEKIDHIRARLRS